MMLRASTGSVCVQQRPAARRSVRALAQVQTAETDAPTGADAAASSSDGAEIYLGFAKDDYAPRAGRKGRVVKDDPSKYPSKEDLGLFLGATGGWAGGEAALWKLRDEVVAQKQQQKKGGAAPAPAAAGKPAVPKPEGGKAPIYLGYSKYDTDLRKVGAPGRFILDDPSKYPSKEDLGFFAGATGGFAAGEKGLKQFIRDGDLQLRSPGQPGGNQSSPVAIAGLLVLAGAGGGLLLNGFADVTESGIKSVNAPIDDNTKVLLLAAVGLMGAAGLVAVGRATASSLQERAAENAKQIALLGAFWVVVFLAARAVLEL
ncbi:MAG: hypothetical protein J3K34DRAFT_433278 [Monoraphidium minutum]|nr:MAG: hypothetical protein J3K34DRAFT_433278 [Monoraphidium minutum]